MREWLNRLVDWFRRDTLDRELAEELRFHKAQLERSGNDGALGNITRVTEDTRAQWSFLWMDLLGQDLRFAWRGLRRTPGFTWTVVAILALGIGANAVMFGVVDRLMFRPPDFLRDPARSIGCICKPLSEARSTRPSGTNTNGIGTSRRAPRRFHTLPR